MPDRYDKAICATELKIRAKIFAEVRAGWIPQGAFQVANTDTQQGNQPESDTLSETSVTSTASHIRDQRINDIANLYDKRS